MAQPTSPSNPESLDADWSEIDQVVNQIAQVAQQEQAEAAFYAEVLNNVISAVVAVGGAIWRRDSRGNLRPVYEVGVPAEVERQRHTTLVAQVIESGAAKALPPQAGGTATVQTNPTEYLLLICPWKTFGEVRGAIELFARPGASPSAQRGYLHFLEAIGELVGDFQRNRELERSRDREQTLQRLTQVTQAVHRSLRVRDTAYAIANEGRGLIDCDRLSVIARRGQASRVLAISGVDAIERRSNVVQQLESLATVAVASGEPIWFPPHEAAAGAALPPEIEDRLHRYLDVSPARLLGLAVLREPCVESETDPPVIGALVIENFESGDVETLRSRTDSIAGHCSAALANALAFERVPSIFRALGSARALVAARHLPKTLLVLVVLVALFAVMMIPARFEIEARGELQPVLRRDIFSPADGTVAQVRVEHGTEVKADTVVALLREPEFDLEFRRVWGELQTAQERSAAIDAERLSGRGHDAQRYRQLTAEQELIKHQIASLQRQHQILQQRQEQLEIRAPIDGKVVTWNVTQLLESRPVRRGQVLMTIADGSGAWELELELPDYLYKHLQDAQNEMGSDLAVAFILATDPGREYSGQLDSVALRTEPNASDLPVCRLTASFDTEEARLLKPGSTVRAKIDCGNRPLGYVWFHRLIEIVQSWILF